MKNILMSLAIVVSTSFIAVNAQTTTPLGRAKVIALAINSQGNIEKRVKIAKEDLPEAVLITYGKSDYANWEFVEADEVTEEETEKTTYEIAVINNEKMYVLFYNAEGDDITPKQLVFNY